jgi:hypothetical protein
MALCEKCGTDATILIDGLCENCKASARRAAAEADPEMVAIRASRAAAAERSAELRDRLESQRRANDPVFCAANDAHRDTDWRAGRPAVGFNSLGDPACAECLAADPDAPMTKLESRLAALEAAQAPTAPKTSTRKAVA